VGTGRRTRAQRGLTLEDGRRPSRLRRDASALRHAHGATARTRGGLDGDVDVVEGPLDGLLPLPAGRIRRAVWLLAPLWHVGFALLAVIGAIWFGDSGDLAPLASTLLYVTAGVLFTVVALLLAALRVQGTRGGAVPLAPVQVAYLMTPVASAVLLSAAYLARIGGGAFFGGFGAMVALIVGLVMLAQRTTELRLGSAGPVSERRTPTAPVVVLPAAVPPAELPAASGGPAVRPGRTPRA
jgi:hypothetical protein